MTELFTKNGDPVRRVAFGTMQFGGRADAEASRQMFDACRAAGIQHFDTAHIYTEGQSETLLGAMIQQDEADLFVASKVGYVGEISPANLQSAFDLSRRRLGMDCVDLLYLHRDPGTDLEAALTWIAQLQKTGAIRYIGLSNFAAWRVMKAQTILARHGTRCDVIQPMYSLVKRQAEVELLPMCLSEGITAVPYSPLGGGLLTGKYARGGTGRLTEDARYAARYELGFMHEAASALADLAASLGVPSATLAVAWTARHKAQPAPIISARSAQQLAPSLAALDYEMDDALYAQISALSPTPAPATDRWEERK